jgi:hypothetical protein
MLLETTTAPKGAVVLFVIPAKAGMTIQQVHPLHLPVDP